ncbi:HNH endonuclease [Mesorhizobium sp. B2-3-14]|uniref:HNH endonuclease n=1 Tax=Mesorhizobium sp. B2-3-14 TaxID=2589950 RepID=UPI0015E274DD|nr:HNH endonuclease [Mesorhizobium sp. B2-3-14]
MKKFVDPNDPYRVRRRNAPKGVPMAFIEGVLLTETDDCILFPFGRNADGYARLGNDEYGHVIVCERAHGPRPSPDDVVAHSCGNPPCVNKRHVRWATHAENAEDRAKHGTNRRPKIAQREIEFIGKELVHVMRFRDIAKMHGVSGSTIAGIARKAVGGAVNGS